MGFDAIACVEVVEHLDPPVLAAFPEVTLGTYRPRVMVVTTPNAEFNVNFPNLKYGTPEATLRNADHRFEWTRKEFQEWCNAAAAKYGYIVSFSGVGSFGSKEYGHCTQLAVFSRVGDEIEENKRNQNQLPTKADVEATSKRNQPYKHLTRLEFPYYDSQDEVTDDKIVEELKDSTCHILYNEMYSSLAGLSAEEQDKTPVERYFEDFKRSFGDIDFGNYWSLLKIRQYCKTREKLIDVFRTQAASALLELVPALPEQLEAKLKARRSSAWGDQLPDLPESQKPWRVRIKFDVPPPPVFSENDDMEREDVNDSSSEEDDDEYVREGDEYHAYDYDHEEPWVESYDKTGEGGDAKSWEPDESYTPQSPVVGWGDPPAASDILSPWGFAS
ncbi:Small RNA 2'-O-methyltransferase [Quaeritorhiza haematococci]|nr:Small RNA 2'-O-methyltransferase [Quaeritorhiza haematococci]